VPRDAFEEVLVTDPAAARVMLTQVAERLRTSGGPPAHARPAQPTVVAVVGLHTAAGAAEVAEALLARLDHHLRVVAPGVVGPDGLERAERDHDRVLLVAEAGPEHSPDEWRDFCLRQADVVVLVASADAALPPPLAPAPARQPDLVLRGAPAAATVAAWTAATDAWQTTVVDRDLPGGLRPVADRLAGRSLGLVLAGGGARAFAHIGVLRELEDSGFHVDRVAGSSVGAIVAAVHATSDDGEELEELCYDGFVRRRPFSDWTLPRHALAKGNRVRSGLVRALGAETTLEGLPRQLRTVSTDLVSRTRVVHRRGNLVDAVTASCRLPVLLAPVPDDEGHLLIDGGVLDNLPVDLLTERDEGPVVAVNIGMGGSGRARTGRPRVPALGETLLRTMMIGSGGAVEAARAHGAWVVSPAPMGVGLLEFHQLDRMVLAGRQAARALLEQADGDLGALAEPAANLPDVREEQAPTPVG
jgi:NTE family protein